MENNNFDQSREQKIIKTPEIWGFKDEFKEYLLLLASKGPIALEASKKYPESIELSQNFHETLNKMRVDTKDGFERWAFMGIKEDKRSILLPTIPIKGAKDHVPSKTMVKMINWAKTKFGIINIFGDIHSHPSGRLHLIDHKIPFRNKHKLIEGFSFGDLYGLIAQRDRYLMMVVSGDFNILACKAKESQELKVGSIFTQNEFEILWKKKMGFSDYLEINLAIAEKHKLVIYQGRKNKRLTKIFPK